jgi:hypothetical protein
VIDRSRFLTLTIRNWMWKYGPDDRSCLGSSLDDLTCRCLLTADSRPVLDLRSSELPFLHDGLTRLRQAPRTVSTDGPCGRRAEFKSTYFETLLARYACTKKTRPPAKPRFGSVCERLFGTVSTQFLYNLRGNTQMTRNVRQVTKSVDPRGMATWSLRELNERLEQYLFQVYDRMEHPALGQSPK